MNGETHKLELEDQLEEFTFLDKSALANNLICNICHRHLNVPPILYVEDMGNVCGRCSADTAFMDMGPVLRQHLYEDLMKNLTFPCTNKKHGCLKVLKFDEVLAHELECRFRCATCPLFYKKLFPEKSCSWTGNTKLLNDHLKTHKDSFLDPPNFIWPKPGENLIFFTTVGSLIATVVVKHEKGSKFVCCVMMNGTDIESQCYRYQLELVSEDKTNSIVLRRGRLEQLSELLDNLQRPEKTLELDIDQISDMLRNPKNVQGRFGIVKKNKKELIQIIGCANGGISLDNSTITLAKETKGNNVPPDDEILSELECPICNEYMIPPIFICPTGHSVCNNCISKVDACPTCRCRYNNGRNYTLEKFTYKIKYPCRNREVGCGFVTTSDKIELHHRNCDLSTTSCVMKCGWEGLNAGLYNHLLDVHADLLLQNNEFSSFENKKDKYLNRCFLYVMGELFCYASKNMGNSGLKINIQHMSMASYEEPKFKYVIQFSTSTNTSYPNFSITNMCQARTSGDSLATYAVIPPELLKLIGSSTYYVKINITMI